MITNIKKDGTGKTVSWTDAKDNCTTVIKNGIYSHYCSNCNNSSKNMKFISETGYYERTITLKCECGTIVKYYS